MLGTGRIRLPRYDYECLNCGHVYELRQSFDADPQGVCPRCEGMSRRKFHAVPVIYKGSGFYTTDYKRGGSSGSSTKEKEEKDSKKESKTAKSTASGSEEKSGTAKASAGSTADSTKDKSEGAKKET